MRAVCIAVRLLLFPAIAVASPSYYDESRPIVLPGGQPGEMRVVQGDGVFGSNPRWPVVVDQGDHLIAWGGKAYGLVLLCSRGSCIAAESAGTRVWDLDAAHPPLAATAIDDSPPACSFLSAGSLRSFGPPCCCSLWKRRSSILAKSRGLCGWRPGGSAGLSQSRRLTTDHDMTGIATFPIRHSRAGGNLG